MRVARMGLAAVALVAELILMGPGRAKAQVVGFAPNVGSLPDGVGLGVTPVVSADRRYVRLGVSPFFQTVNGFQTFPVPAAVGGGGFRSLMGDPFEPFGLGYWPAYEPLKPKPAKARAIAKAAKAKAARARKPLPDPVVLPIKKKAEPQG